MPYNFTTMPWFISKTALLVVILGLLASWTQAPSSTDDLHYVSNSCLKTMINSTFVLGSSFQASLNQTLLSQFPDEASKLAFSTFTNGSGVDQLYALYYCKGDVDHKTCHDCVQAAAVKVIDVCKFKKEAIIWYEECTLRYANHPIFSIDDEFPPLVYSNNTGIVNAYHLDQYQDIFDSMMKSVIKEAANSRGALPGFATKEVNLSSTQTLHGLAQCTPDIVGPKCYRCLNAALAQKDSWANTIIFLPSCFVRYDLYGSIPLPPPPPPPPGDPPLWGLLIGVIVVSVVIFLVLAWICCWVWRHHCRPVVEIQEGSNPRKFSFWEIMRMTGFFTIKLGEGSFGVVYSGKYGEDKVAVKVIKRKNAAASQFKTEREVSERVTHENVLSLIGYCEGWIKLCLVYEDMDCKDLKTCLLCKDKTKELRWKERLSIAIDAAKGLQYLHEQSECIVHRDVKPSNILIRSIDGGCKQAKIADFGICRIYPRETFSTYFSTKEVSGTIPYMDPLYMNSRRMSKKIDVYGLGIVLLQLITGRVPQLDGGVDVITFVNDNLLNNNVEEILDSRVKQDVGTEYKSIREVVTLAFKCVQTKSKARPKMRNIVQELTECMNNLARNNNTASSSDMPSTSREAEVTEIGQNVAVWSWPPALKENEYHTGNSPASSYEKESENSSGGLLQGLLAWILR